MTITGVDGQPRGLRYTLSDGRFGTLEEDAPGLFRAGTLSIRLAPCRAGTLNLSQNGVAARGTRIRLVERTVRFSSDGIELHGKIVLPAGGRADTAAVWIEGSNNDPSTDDSVWPYALAQRGIAVFVYDKRGTGASGGALTSDFHARARDTAAAVKAARRLAPGIRRIGTIGGSQGGWVAPLVATLVPLDFVIPAFALADGPIAQDRALVAQQLRQAGFDDAARAQAAELTAITERIVRSNLGDGLADLDAFKAKHAGAPWLAAIQPRSYTGLFLKFPSDLIRSAGPAMAQGLTFDFEPRPVIEAIKARQLWLLAGRDQQAPNAATQAILRDIQQKRRDVAVIVFPNADHGLIEPVQTAEGAGLAYSSQLFDVTAAWIMRGMLPGAGSFVVMPGAR